MTDTEFALVTKTWRGDRRAFADLCESMDRHMPGTLHYVLHERRDRDLFAHYASEQRRLMTTDELLPKLRGFGAFGRRLWHRRPAYLVRGWIYQQLAKLAFVATMRERAAVLVDSDAVLVAPIAADHVFANGKVRFFRDPGAPSGPPGQGGKWHDVAARALGLTPRGYSGADYITNPLVWSPAVVRAMLQRIEGSGHADWTLPLIRPIRFSECVLYGMFCDHVDGPHRDEVSPVSKRIGHISWGYDLLTPAGVRAFAASVGDRPAVLIQSNLGLTDAARRAILHQVSQHVAA